MKRHTIKPLIIILEVIGVLIAVVFMYPAFTVIINSFKPLGEIVRNPFALPKAFTTANLSNIIKNMGFFRALFNTLFIAVIVVSVTVTLSAMAGYKLGRTGGKISTVISMIFISCMLVPFQTIIIPVVKMANMLNIVSTFGYILITIPLYAPMGIFVFQGFVKTVPLSLEESAIVEGCNPFGVFFKIVLPLLKPSLSSVAILYTLWIWGDYAMPSLMLNTDSKRTLTLMVYSGFSTFLNRWDFALAALSLSLIPVLVFYVFMQKYIVKGVTSGAVKG
jgi:raffinose/stachyose/melibiose transport system permease protein